MFHSKTIIQVFHPVKPATESIPLSSASDSFDFFFFRFGCLPAVLHVTWGSFFVLLTRTTIVINICLGCFVPFRTGFANHLFLLKYQMVLFQWKHAGTKSSNPDWDLRGLKVDALILEKRVLNHFILIQLAAKLIQLKHVEEGSLKWVAQVNVPTVSECTLIPDIGLRQPTVGESIWDRVKSWPEALRSAALLANQSMPTCEPAQETLANSILKGSMLWCLYRCVKPHSSDVR